MLLQRLAEYATRIESPPRLYVEAPVRYIIDLTGQGTQRSRTPIDTSDPTRPATRRGTRRLVPQIMRAVGIKPLLLADNAEYTLGLAREDSKPDRVANCHAAYLELLRRCSAATEEPSIAAVLRFLESDPAATLELGPDFDRGAIMTFSVDGQFPTDLPSVQQFWATENDPALKGASQMQCIVCGQRRPVLGRLQAKIKGVPGGQTAGTSIISANSDAFESYGLHASLIAPTCADCGERFTRAANDLLADPAHRTTLGGAAFIFWTRAPSDDDYLTLLRAPQAEQVRDLLRSVRSGQPLPEVDDIAFYATALSGSGGRVVVRDWIDSTVGQVRRYIRIWFERQRVVGPWGEEPRPLGVFELAAATVRDAKDLVPTVPRALIRAALTGTPVPQSVLHGAVGRSLAERQVTCPRAAVIKLALTFSDEFREEDSLVTLAPDHPSAAYHCGRLLAVLEEVQRQAIPNIKATIVDRFFGTAATAPASVFGRLLRGAQPHLGKLERDRPGAYYALQRRLEEIQARLGSFPRTLTLTDQGLFALGYYHQRATDRAQRAEAAQRRREGPEPSGTAVDRDGDDVDIKEN